MQTSFDSRALAVLWDIDDVLVDTTAMYRTSRLAAFKALELSTNEAKLLDIWDRLFWFFDQDDTEGILLAILAEVQMDNPRTRSQLKVAIEAFDAVWNRDIVPVDGVVSIVQRLNQCGIPQAIMSNGNRVYQLQKIKQVGLSELFDSQSVLIAERSSLLAKPRPHGIIHACQTLDVSPSDSIYVGDRSSDVIAANMAGAISVLLRRTPSAPEVMQPPLDGALSIELPQYVVESVVELEELLAKATKSADH